MEDGEGRHIDFRNTIIILTSNVGTDLIAAMCADPELMPEPDALSGACASRCWRCSRLRCWAACWWCRITR